MYHHCLYCAADLGANEALEAFPVGRRLAFDPARGRLWVVCRKCERWNLSPLEERWEALEACERRYRDSRTRVSTENIGLARLREGLDLVRIGRPQRPEFAAWRYGDQFGQRRRRYALRAGAGVALVGAVALGGTALVGGAAAFASLDLLNLLRILSLGRKGLRVPLRDGGSIRIPGQQVGLHTLRPTGDGVGLALNLGTWADEDRRILHGAEALDALAFILPRVNRSGAKRRDVGLAVGRLEEAGGPDGFFREVEQIARSRGRGYSWLSSLPTDLRLALEMATHEDQERRALEGELELLERAWREAESLADIADGLLVPEPVGRGLSALKRRSGRATGGSSA